MPDPTPKPPLPDVTVTSATQTDAEVRASLGEPPVVEEKPPVVEKTDEEKAQDAEALEVDQHLDKVEPPKAGETAEEKASRQKRATGKVLKEIALRKQAEERADAAERELKELRTRHQAPKPAPTPGAKAPDAPIADGKDSAPKFEFPTFDEYQEKNPDADLRDYTIALTDARTEFLQTRATERATADAVAASERELTTTHKSAEAEFRAAHPDYEEKLKNVVLPPDKEPGVRDPLVRDLEVMVLKAGKEGPAILYFLGQNPAEVTRLTSAQSRTELAMTFGEIRGAARASLASPSGDLPKPKPKTHAPAPITPTPGEHKTERSLQDIADEDEDADAYIAAVKKRGRAS